MEKYLSFFYYCFKSKQDTIEVANLIQIAFNYILQIFIQLIYFPINYLIPQFDGNRISKDRINLIHLNLVTLFNNIKRTRPFEITQNPCFIKFILI